MPLLRNPNAFADYPLDKAGFRRRDSEWLADALAHEASQLALLRNLNPFCNEEGVVWFAGAARDALCGPEANTIFLGVDNDGRPYFAAEMTRDPAESIVADMGAFEDMRAAAARLADRETAILGCARALYEWHGRHSHCSNCGAATFITDGGWRRQCPACKAEHFPKVDPVVIMLPVLGDRCCLGRQARFPRGMYSALAGFVEPGESLEEACAREVKEEVGLDTIDVRYHSTQPWPFPHSLMIGLIAEVSSDELTLDQDEIDEAIWLTRDEARAAISGGGTLADGRRVFAPPPFAIAHQLIKAWVNEG
ncbi:MAG: NAD(+) diphosphatase [Alphaproteobacteria bacterium]|nr:NAD(+) diphosphatase [Alphaproteobacteria bacterium]